MNQTQTRSLRKKVLSLILAVVMAVSLLPISAFASGDSKASTTGDTGYYKILHLDCGRKYFSKDWIIALLNEMDADGYNQLQLAFGNDGLRFLLDDMSFTANGTEYSHQTVVSKVEAGNKAQNSSGDERWLSQSEMDEIIAAADNLGIAIVPLLNLPGHANAILDIADDAYNASGSDNTLDVANSKEARDFGMAIFKKYVDYFAGKGCKFFNFGADEYANDLKNADAFSFSNLNDTQYQAFIGFINDLADYISGKTVAGEKMTPRAFNDGLYYNNSTDRRTNQTFADVAVNTAIQCCYWSSGWGSYPVAYASTIANKGHAMINTNGDYYYVLGKDDAFTPDETKVHDAGLYTAAKGFNNTAFMSSTISDPVGSMFCIWSDYPKAETETQIAQNVRLVMRAMALRMNGESIDNMGTSVVTNGFNADGTLNAGSTNGAENGNTVEITVAVGDTAEWKTSDGNLEQSGGYTTDDESVASVTVKDQQAVAGETKYTEVSVSYADLNTSVGNNTNWRKTNYYYKPNNSSEHYPVYAKYEYGYYYQYGYSTDDSENNVQRVGYIFYWGNNATVYQQTTTDPTPASTTITFTGHKVGDTTVVIGGVTYKIHVTDAAPSNALTTDTITLEHWITNARVAETSGATGDDRNVQEISKTTAGIQSEDGVAVEKLAYTPYGYRGDTKVYYWQGMKLDKNNVQTDASGDDETADGTTLTHIRYYGNAWQYKTADETWHYFQNTDQFVIYYLQKTEVTKEVDTYVKDWGFDTKETTKDWSDGKGQVALTIAVVYPNGTVSPVESSMYSNSTIIYNYVDGRDIGIVAPKNNSDYNIAKITVTDGTRDSNRSSNVWYTYDTITWDKTTDSATDKTWYNETEVWNKSSGTTPMVNGKTSNITWSAKNTAKLVLIYLETVERETNLNVVYWDDNAGVKITGSQIAMKFTQGDPEPSFKTDLKGVTAGVISWPSNDKSSSEYLPDTAYVTNSSGVNQTCNKDLLTVSGVTGVYASGLYEYVSADISEDGKTLTLHYNLKQVEGKTYVLDFGLPIEIPAVDFGITNYASVASISFDPSDKSETEKQGEYGKGKINTTTGTVTYTLTEALNSKVAIPIYVTFKGDEAKTERLQVYIIPATSVYYEDSFASFTNADKSTGVNQGTGNGYWVTDGTTQADVNQALEALGDKTTTKNVYGYDPAYANSSEFSMGSATKVTVDANTSSLGQSPTATFTFKGTGFDVISLTGNKSGTVMYTVTNTETKNSYSKLVNTYYGYTYTDGKWTTTDSANPNALYQIPVIKETGLDYSTYEVKISVLYGDYFNSTSDKFYSFWLDAVRVYDPMGTGADANANYTQDGEGYPQYIKLHDELAQENSTVTAKGNLLFIDGAANANIDLYRNYGPNNEVYLANGQAISFKIPTNANIASIQIGAKAPNGNAAEMDVNGTKTEIPSATEMYYQIATTGNQSFTIANTGTGILSLTNLKITYTESSSVTLAPLSDEDQANAVALVRALFAEPVEPFNPDRLEASWGHSVRQGETATLTVKTSEDVEAITVDGQTIDTYVTRTERSGWGWWAKTVTYREFTYTTTADVTTDYTVCAVNGEGVSSDAITATLTVRPSVRDWLHGIIGKWF